MRLALAAALAAMAELAHAACTVSTLSVLFGTYNPMSGNYVDGVGQVDVVCAPAAAYSIALSAGTGTYANRAMANGPHRLAYNLFNNATRTVVWGDGTDGTAVVGGNGATGNHAVYGRIPGAQNAPVGQYGDALTVTVSF